MVWWVSFAIPAAEEERRRSFSCIDEEETIARYASSAVARSQPKQNTEKFN